MSLNNNIPRAIIATTHLELAALRALFELADAHWHGCFPSDVEQKLFEITKIDEERVIDLNTLANLMDSWSGRLR